MIRKNSRPANPAIFSFKKLKSVKRFLLDVSGAYGDLGTFLPLTAGLVVFCGFNPVIVFFIAGLLYIISAINFGVPISVQPLKAVASLSIALSLPSSYVRIAGLGVGIICFLVYILKLDKWLEILFPRPIIKGIQAGLGIMLLKNGIKLIFSPPDSLFTFRSGSSAFVLPNLKDVLFIFHSLVLPQVALSFANSVVSTRDVCLYYFKEKAARVTTGRLILSIFFMNVFSSITGGIPHCHGATGVTAHYSFGARTKLSTIITGSSFIILSLLFDGNHTIIISLLTPALLGLMLIYIGISHIFLIKELKNFSEILLALSMGFLIILTGNLFYSYIFGSLIWRVQRRHSEKNIRREIPSIRYKESSIPYSKPITYLRISLTPECNLRCIYCYHPINDGKRKNILGADRIYEIVKIGCEVGIEKVRLTGGEPLLRKDVLKIIKKLRSIDGLKEIALSTNGLLLERFARALKDAGVDRINVSLDTLKKEKFISICGVDGLDRIIRGIERAIEAGLTPVKINTVVMRGFNDDEILDFLNFSEDKNIIIRFIEYMPVNITSRENFERWKRYFFSRQDILNRVSHLLDDEVRGFKKKGEVARYYILKNGATFGIISPVTHGFCSDCNRLRLTYDGKLLPCLTSSSEIDLSNCTRPEEIKRAFILSFTSKPASGVIPLKDVKRNIMEIGG